MSPRLLTAGRSLVQGLFAGRHIPGRGCRSGRSYAFTLLTPIRRGHEADLAAHLKGLSTGEESPLARLPYVHVGRWMVIDQLKMGWPGAPRRPARLQSQYLLFSATVTAPDEDTYADDLPESFLRELATRIPDEAEAIWGHCVGYPGSASVDAFVRYLSTSRLETSLFYVGYPDVTVQQVRQALATRDRLVDFVRDHQNERDPAQLQRAYLQESATWFP